MNNSFALVGIEKDIGLRSPAPVSPELVVEIQNHERPVSTGTIPFRGILFPSAADRVPDERLAAPDFFVDLNLDQIIAAIKAGKDLEELLKRHGLERPVQRMGFPRKFLDSAAGVAVFYNEGEGTEMLNGYFMLVSALNKQIDPLTQAEMEILQAFIEEEAISPAFVRRVIRDAGSEGIGSIFFPMAKMASNIFYAGSKAATTAIAIPASPCGEEETPKREERVSMEINVVCESI